MKSLVYIIVGIIIIAGAAFAYQAYYLPTQPGYDADDNRIVVTNYEECVAAGYPVMESDPEQCSDGEQTFTSTDSTSNNDSMPVEPDGGIGDGAEPLDEISSEQAQIEAAQALELIGLTEEEAVGVAADNDISFRVVERDGESLPVTMDYRPGRINAVVEGDAVIEYSVEGADSQ